jgi:methionine synthase II (cobalamin-independent)
VKARGDDPDTLPLTYAGMINAAIADIPPDMTITMHLCRGNFRSNFVASGGYEPVADILFNTINVHGYFMEYDSERAGGFGPLRLLPTGKTVVLGLATSKTGQLESKDAIKRRIDEGREVRPARSAGAVAAVRLCLDRGRQRAGRRRTVGEARDDCGDRRRGMGKRMKRTKPPFRADHVGSLLRPAALHEARAKRPKAKSLPPI